MRDNVAPIGSTLKLSTKFFHVDFTHKSALLNGFQNLLLNHYHLNQIQQPLYLLSGFGAITLLLATFIYQRQLTKQARF